MSSEIKKRVLDCYEMSNLLYGTECWLKKRLSNRHAVLPTNTNNIVDRTCEKQGNVTENRNYKEIAAYK